MTDTTQPGIDAGRLTIGNRYDVDLANPIGVGGMATVYPGIDVRSGRKVAVKTLLPEYQRDPHARQRFRREARMMAFVSHPNLVTIYDLHDESSGSWMVMEYVEGTNLRDRLDREGPLHPETVMDILDQVGGALGHMHERRLVHLDIKPQNLIQAPNGAIKIIDFGLAQQMGMPQDLIGGTAFGTAAYLAPEQATGDTVTPATDVYSLGCVTYELLTGRPPFVAHGADEKRQLIDAHLNDSPALPSAVAPQRNLDTWVDDVLGWALAKDPASRFQSVQTLVAMFQSGLEGEDVDQTAPRTRAAASAIRPAGPGIFRSLRRRRRANERHAGRDTETSQPVDQIPEITPFTPGPAERLYRKGGKIARRARPLKRSLWRLVLMFAMANLLLGSIIVARDGPSGLVERFLSLAPGTSTVVIGGPLNLRSAPGIDSPLIAELPDGQQVRVTGLSASDEQGRWWPVETTISGQHMDGWVWEGGLKPNTWTGRLSWMQDIVDGTRSIGGSISNGVNALWPGSIGVPSAVITSSPGTACIRQ